MPSFGSGFAQGLSSTLPSSMSFLQQQRQERLQRERMRREDQRWQREQTLRELQFGESLRQFEEEMGVRRERLGFEQEQHEELMDFREEELGFQREKHEAEVGIAEEELDLSKTREQRLQEAQEIETDLQQKRLELEQRSFDIEVHRRIDKAFDPTIPKPVRQQILRNSARLLDIPTDGERYKEMERTITSLDDDVLKDLQGTLAAVAPDLPPGQLSAISGAVLSGNVELTDIMDALEQGRQSRMRQQAFGMGGGGMQQPEQEQQEGGTPGFMFQQESLQSGVRQEQPGGGDTSLSEPQSPEELLDAAQFLAANGDLEGARMARQMARDLWDAQEFDPEAVEERAAAEATGERRAFMGQRMPKSALDIVGLPTADITRAEAQELGMFPDILDDPEKIMEIREDKAQSMTTLTNIRELADTVKGRADVLGVSGALARGLDNLIENIAGLAQGAGGFMGLDPRTLRDVPIIRSILEEGELSKQSAEVRSMTIDLAYELARARQDGRLSNQMIDQALQTLGAGPSPDQFRSTLLSLHRRLERATAARIEAQTGMKPMELMTDEELEELWERVQEIEANRRNRQ